LTTPKAGVRLASGAKVGLRQQGQTGMPDSGSGGARFGQRCRFGSGEKCKRGAGGQSDVPG
jgi:hypothetical protein